MSRTKVRPVVEAALTTRNTHLKTCDSSVSATRCNNRMATASKTRESSASATRCNNHMATALPITPRMSTPWAKITSKITPTTKAAKITPSANVPPRILNPGETIPPNAQHQLWQLVGQKCRNREDDGNFRERGSFSKDECRLDTPHSC